ncbi:MAG: S41 family peptidase [Pseudomonadota bacterium]
MNSIIIALTLTMSLCPAERITLNAAAAAIEHQYIIEDEAYATAASLRAVAEQASLGDKCRRPQALAEDLEAYLRETTGDPHFAVDAPDTNAGNDNWIAEWYKDGARNGYGLEKVEILEGNVGLIRISSFYDMAHAGSRLTAAFELVADTDGLILDLRNNGGGSPETATPLIWTFLPETAEPPLRQESRIHELDPPVRIVGPWQAYGTERPLVILINSKTFSAPEAVAYSLQAAHRTTIIGEPSGGGAHMLGEGQKIGSGLDLYIPDTRPISPATGTNWESTGVIPDITATSETSLEVAWNHILELLRVADPPADK